MDLDYRAIEKVICFCQEFPEDGASVWHDEKGCYEILRGDGILKYDADRTAFREIFIARFLKNSIVPSSVLNNRSNTSSRVLSIGTFDTHNKAKNVCNRYDLELTTVPLPLANDSFGTNRIGKENGPSLEGPFPAKTIFDIRLARKVHLPANILGIGEFVGLYASVIDFYLAREESPPQNLLDFISELACNLWRCFNNNPEAFIRSLTTALLFKVLIMRVSGDYQIGCSADHIVASFLERKFRMPHGKAVYASLLFLLLLYPEWEEYGLCFSELESLGIETGVVSSEDLDMTTSIEVFKLVSNALNMRPLRPTVLSRLESARNQIDAMNQRIERYREENKWPTLS